jgi:hypothetical protein
MRLGQQFESARRLSYFFDDLQVKFTRQSQEPRDVPARLTATVPQRA